MKAFLATLGGTEGALADGLLKQGLHAPTHGGKAEGLLCVVGGCRLSPTRAARQFHTWPFNPLMEPPAQMVAGPVSNQDSRAGGNF